MVSSSNLYHEYHLQEFKTDSIKKNCIARPLVSTQWKFQKRFTVELAPKINLLYISTECPN